MPQYEQLIEKIIFWYMKSEIYLVSMYASCLATDWPVTSLTLDIFSLQLPVTLEYVFPL